MAFSLRVFLVLFISSFVTVRCGDEGLQRYMSLISSIHEQYLTSVVCLSLPHKDSYSSEFILASVFIREFSRNGVRTAVIRNDKIQTFSQSYGTHVSRPLVVVLLRAVEEIYDFSENKQKMTKLNPIWLLIFTDELGTQVCDYCKEPLGNIFHVRFDTEMLVSCCNDPTLKEWWSIFPNKTETAVLGNWTTEDGFKFLASKSLYKRRNGLNGLNLRVAMVPGTEHYLEKNGEADGFFIALVKELQRAMDFGITVVTTTSKVANSTSVAFDVMTKLESDIYVESFIITKKRMNIVDFTYPFLESRLQLVVKESDSSDTRTAYFKVFTLPLWLTILSLTIASTILLAIVEVRKQHSFIYSFFMNYLNIWGIFCTQGIPVFPVRSSLKIIYFSVFVMALVVSATYNGLLISYATVSPPTLPFSTVEEFADDGSYGVITFKNSVQWGFLHLPNDAIMAKMRSLIVPEDRLPNNGGAALKQVCNEKVGLMAISTGLKSKYSENLPCDLHFMDGGFSVHMAMIMSHGSPFTDIINYQIQRFRETGVMNHIKMLYKKAPTEISPTGTTFGVTLSGVAPVFFILAGGMATALFVLLCERLYATSCNSHSLSKQRKQIVNFKKNYSHRSLKNLKKNQPCRLQLGFRQYPKYSSTFQRIGV